MGTGWQADGPDANYTLFSWILGGTDAGNVMVTGPTTATIGGAGTVNLNWSGRTAGKKYLGQIAYQDGATTQGTTIVRVDSSQLFTEGRKGPACGALSLVPPKG